MDHCFQVPGVAILPKRGDRREILPSPPLWSLSVSGGLSPRDGGATGAYGAVELRQIGHGYVQVGGMRYHTPLLSDAVSAASTFNVGTLAGGVNLNNWLLDGYVSYGWQDFGAVRVDDGSGQTTLVRPSNAATKGSPYYGAGISLGRMIPVNNRIFITPTAAVVYAWGRWLHPAGSIPDPRAGARRAGLRHRRTTWTGTARLRIGPDDGQGGAAIWAVGGRPVVEQRHLLCRSGRGGRRRRSGGIGAGAAGAGRGLPAAARSLGGDCDAWLAGGDTAGAGGDDGGAHGGAGVGGYHHGQFGAAPSVLRILPRTKTGPKGKGLLAVGRIDCRGTPA
jgi:hypothetical protein